MIILGEDACNPNLFVGATGSAPAPTPSIPTTLGSRIDNKATVVGVLQDHEGNDYVLAVVDAAYRSGEAMAWGTNGVDTPLPNDDDSTKALADHHTGKYNTDLILSTYTATDYPAFNFARNACTVSIGGNTYYSVLPSARELKLLWDNKDILDQYDPTLNEYPDRSISDFSCGTSSYTQPGLLSSNESSQWITISIKCNYPGYVTTVNKDLNYYGVCPVICISLI